MFGSRFGKSGMSLVLSLLASTLGEAFGFRQLTHLSVFAATGWLSSTWWLSSLLPRKDVAQALVQARQEQEKETQRKDKRQ